MRFQDLFRGYTKYHGTSKPKGTVNAKGKAEFAHFTKTGPPTADEWAAHFTGKGNGLGCIPLMDDNYSVCWGALDIDVYPLDHAKLEQDCAKLPLVITKSKSGGAHLWLFLREPTSAQLVISKLTEWASALGRGGCEVFPKQYKRVIEDDQGNWINLPYYGDTRKCFFQGQERTLEEFLEIAESRCITEEMLRKIEVVSDTEGQFLDGPPCLQVLSKVGIAEGGRNNAMFNVGIYFYKKSPDTVLEDTKNWNRSFVDPPLPDAEIADSVKTIIRKGDYNFTCSKHPIHQHCNRALCIKREFGVATGGASNDELNVVLSGLTKIDTSEPVWQINIDGVRTSITDTTILLNQARFGVVCVEKVHKILKPISSGKWNEMMQELLDKMEVTQAAFDASPEGQFLLYLMDYIQLRKSDSKEAIAAGNVYYCEKCKKAYFRSTDFYQYLSRQGFRDLKKNRCYELLNSQGLTKGRWNIKGMTVAYWAVPVESIQKEAFEVPSFGGLGDSDAQ